MRIKVGSAIFFISTSWVDLRNGVKVPFDPKYIDGKNMLWMYYPIKFDALISRIRTWRDVEVADDVDGKTYNLQFGGSMHIKHADHEVGFEFNLIPKNLSTRDKMLELLNSNFDKKNSRVIIWS